MLQSLQNIKSIRCRVSLVNHQLKILHGRRGVPRLAIKIRKRNDPLCWRGDLEDRWRVYVVCNLLKTVRRTWRLYVWPGFILATAYSGNVARGTRCPRVSWENGTYCRIINPCCAENFISCQWDSLLLDVPWVLFYLLRPWYFLEYSFWNFSANRNRVI